MTRVALLAFAGLAAILLVAGGALAQSGDPAPGAPTWIDTDQNLRFTGVPGGAPDEGEGPAEVTVNTTVRLHQFQYNGDSYSADRFREAYDQNVIGDDAVRQLEDRVENETLDGVENLLPIKGQARIVSPAQLTPESLNAGSGGHDYKPPLVVEVTVEGDLDLAAVAGSGVSQKEIRIAFELGASLDLPLSTSVDAGNNLTTRVHAPAGLAWKSASGATVADGGSTAVVEIANWRNPSARSHSANLVATDPDERSYSSEDVSLNVTVNIQGVDIQLSALAGGSLGEGHGRVVIDGAIEVLKLPSSAPDVLQEAGVTHISAADIRLLVAEGLVDRETLEQRVDNLTAGYADDLPSRVDILFTGGLVDGTLERRPPVKNETARPVRLHVTADVTVDLAFGGSGAGGAQGITFHTIDRSFTFSPLKSRPTTYKVILPKGVDLRGVDAPSADPVVGTTEDGRDFFSLHVDEGEEHTATVHAAFTAMTLWHQAPELLALLALLVLLPVVLVAWLVFRRGGDEEPTRVEAPDEDQPP